MIKLKIEKHLFHLLVAFSLQKFNIYILFFLNKFI